MLQLAFLRNREIMDTCSYDSTALSARLRLLRQGMTMEQVQVPCLGGKSIGKGQGFLKHFPDRCLEGS